MTHEQIAVDIFTFLFCGIQFAWSCREFGLKQATKNFALGLVIAFAIYSVAHFIFKVTP